ncbi:MAG: SagB/ThcOx family dehydrogenase [Candidatus Cloacimonetes bacterium]|nr:SagB/ThcOx family dehydrogenase [Candidatus Cloacimonadota bacterium]
MANEKIIKLPQANFKGGISLEETLQKRRSRRRYRSEALSKKELSQILWSAQGITKEPIFRTAPSAGALYPIDIYVSIINVKDVDSGFYLYIPVEHHLIKIDSNSYKDIIYYFGYRQECLKNPALITLMVADYTKITPRYDERGYRYTFMEAGHISQNIYLQCESLGLGTVAVGAYDEEKLTKLLPVKNDVIYIMPIGKLF